ncbi:hypothetical protein JHK87_034259 [Glycine soja]|nr:hypothetical protein JHK87_034259 [Glycine soja]
MVVEEATLEAGGTVLCRKLEKLQAEIDSSFCSLHTRKFVSGCFFFFTLPTSSLLLFQPPSPLHQKCFPLYWIYCIPKSWDPLITTRLQHDLKGVPLLIKNCYLLSSDATLTCRDEFESPGLEDCLDKTWPMAFVYVNDGKSKYLDRCYGRVSRRKLKERLVEGCVSNGVRFHKAKGSLVVDVSGFGSSFVAYDKVKNHGFQIAHSVLAEVDDHPFDLDKMVLVDWRDSHLGNEPYLRASSSRFPTFLYAMPFSSNLIFLEETSLVTRPVLYYMEVKRRMVARLRHLGIRVKRVLEDEKCLIPMGGPLPRTPQEVMAIGSTSGVVHPSTGYMVARTMAVTPVVAFAIAECLGSTRMIRGKQLSGKVLNSMWPIENRLVREFYSFGMETLLKVDLNGNRSFFDAFFDLKPYYWQGFLSSRLTLNELVWLSISLFGHASNPSRFDILTKCHVPLAKMMGNIALEYIG